MSVPKIVATLSLFGVLSLASYGPALSAPLTGLSAAAKTGAQHSDAVQVRWGGGIGGFRGGVGGFRGGVGGWRGGVGGWRGGVGGWRGGVAGWRGGVGGWRGGVAGWRGGVGGWR